MTVRSYPFSINGDNFEFRVVSGTVVGTDQRSDTRVWGSGSTVVIDGTGGGRTTINSQVDVVRDLWLRDDNGQEQHFRFAQDIPFREGQRVHCIYLSGPNLENQEAFNAVYSVYNVSVNRFWTVGDPANLLKMPKFVGGVDWFLGIFGILFFGIGLLWLALCIIFRLTGYKSGGEARRIQSAALKEIKEHHQKLVDELYSAHQLQQPDTVAALP
jgi:hypothetical protein